MQQDDFEETKPPPVPWWKRIAIGAGAMAGGAVAFIALGQGYALMGGT